MFTTNYESPSEPKYDANNDGIADSEKQDIVVECPKLFCSYIGMKIIDKDIPIN